MGGNHPIIQTILEILDRAHPRFNRPKTPAQKALMDSIQRRRSIPEPLDLGFRLRQMSMHQKRIGCINDRLPGCPV